MERSFDKHVLASLQTVFATHIKPDNVLNVFHCYNSKILTQADIETVKSTTERQGDQEGARVLFERLRRYERWYECLLEVLRDQGVKLPYVADKLERCTEPYEAGLFNLETKLQYKNQGPLPLLIEDYMLDSTVDEVKKGLLQLDLLKFVQEKPEDLNMCILLPGEFVGEGDRVKKLDDNKKLGEYIDDINTCLLIQLLTK